MVQLATVPGLQNVVYKRIARTRGAIHMGMQLDKKIEKILALPFICRKYVGEWT